VKTIPNAKELAELIGRTWNEESIDRISRSVQAECIMNDSVYLRYLSWEQAGFCYVLENRTGWRSEHWDDYTVEDLQPGLTDSTRILRRR
jgi:hypothetical protein